jgi:hypothetical protein
LRLAASRPGSAAFESGAQGGSLGAGGMHRAQTPLGRRERIALMNSSGASLADTVRKKRPWETPRGAPETPEFELSESSADNYAGALGGLNASARASPREQPAEHASASGEAYVGRARVHRSATPTAAGGELSESTMRVLSRLHSTRATIRQHTDTNEVASFAPRIWAALPSAFSRTHLSERMRVSAPTERHLQVQCKRPSKPSMSVRDNHKIEHARISISLTSLPWYTASAARAF